jgi:hypothetical protein
LFFAGGADRFVTDYPLSGAPAMNALFQGARGIYNASGDFYQEPMELIDAEYSWNVRPGFFRVPATYNEARELVRRYADEQNQPPEVFGPGGLYERACDLLYGAKAGPVMAAYYRLSAELPEKPAAAGAGGRRQTYLPETWDRAYAAPSHWRHLIEDSLVWGTEITDETFGAAVKRMHLDTAELHRRLARRWRICAELNRRGGAKVEEALAAGPIPEAREDLQFLKRLLAAYQPLMAALTEYHAGVYARLTAGPSPANFERAARLAAESERIARRSFPQPIDPVGGEIGTLRTLTARLVQTIAAAQRQP